MQTGAPQSTVIQAMFSNLIDYAGLFPPAKLPMEEAVREYAAERQGAYAFMLGRFIVQQSRTAQLRAALPQNERFAVSVILDGGAGLVEEAARLRQDAALELQALEIVLEPEQIDAYAAAVKRQNLADVPSYVEFVRDRNWEYVVPDVMAALAEHGLGAKIRCGGLEAQAFPSPAEVAVFLYWARRYNVPFKATAGLHHPVRHFDAQLGVRRHGFLNLLVAATLAGAGMNVDGLIEPLACEDGTRFHIDDRGMRFGDHHAGVAQLESMRREAFIAYGSCSFSEPVDDLRAMGVLS